MATKQDLERALDEQEVEAAKWHHNAMMLARAVLQGSSEATAIASFLKTGESPLHFTEESRGLMVKSWPLRMLMEAYIPTLQKPDGGWWNYTRTMFTYGDTKWEIRFQRDDGLTPEKKLADALARVAELEAKLAAGTGRV